MNSNILISTNSQKTLDFLIENPEKMYLSKEIRQVTKISKSGTNFALKELAKHGFIIRNKRGRVHFYSVSLFNPVIKQLKITKTIISLIPLIEKIKNNVEKIILYGSASRGENTRDSDIDLLIVTNSNRAVENIVKQNKLNNKIQLTLRTVLKYIEMKKKEPTFFNEIERGIVLWEKRDEF